MPSAYMVSHIHLLPIRIKCLDRAILTPYTSNRAYIDWCEQAHFVPRNPRYDLISGFTAELFDNFMDYKRLLKKVQDIISYRSSYQVRTATNAISLDITTLLSVRSALRDEQSKIVEAVCPPTPLLFIRSRSSFLDRGVESSTFYSAAHCRVVFGQQT